MLDCGFLGYGEAVKHLHAALIALHDVLRDKDPQMLRGRSEGKMNGARNLPHRRLAVLFEILEDREAPLVRQRLQTFLELSHALSVPYSTIRTNKTG